MFSGQAARWKADFRLPPAGPQRILVGVIAIDSLGSGLYLTATGLLTAPAARLAARHLARRQGTTAS